MIKLIKLLSCLKAYSYSIKNFSNKCNVKQHFSNKLKSYCYKFVLENYGYELSRQTGSCVDVNGNPIPWYTYPSIEYLNQFDYSEKRVFEYGCGNSSLYWAKRAKEVISVDDNEDWHGKIFNSKPDNLSVILEKNWDLYAKSLEKYGKFDIIVIDGYVRDKCAEIAVKHLNKGGFVILENSDRCPEFEEYSKAAKILKMHDLLQVDFFGYGPLNEYTWCTSLFLSKDLNFKTKSEFQPIKGINNLT